MKKLLPLMLLMACTAQRDRGGVGFVGNARGSSAPLRG